MQAFIQEKIRQIHDASMEILSDTGVRFNSNDALEIFQKHGFKTDGSQVLITEKDIMRALDRELSGASHDLQALPQSLSTETLHTRRLSNLERKRGKECF